MKQLWILFVFVSFSSLLLNCQQPKEEEKVAEKVVEKKYTYNEKAHELILHVVNTQYGFSSQSGCNCIIESPIDTTSRMTENDKMERRKRLREMLDLNENENVDSLVKVANNFKWDRTFLEENNIQLITAEMTKAESKKMNRFADVYKMCPDMMIIIQRPIFDQGFKNAIINYQFPYHCTPSPIATYQFESGKWVSK